MQLRFLGTGTSAGVPVIGCGCSVCTSTDPRDHRTRTSSILEFTDPNGHPRVILIDASPDLRQQVLRERFERIDAILVTHDHADHVFGLDEVRRFNVMMESSIPVYTDAATHASLRRVFPYILDRDGPAQSFVSDLNPITVEPLTPFELFGLTITPIPLLHGRQPILGFRFDDPDRRCDRDASLLPLSYCTDVSAFPAEAWPTLEGTRTLVLDCLRHRPHPTHLTVDQAIEAAGRIGSSRTFLVHMTHDLGHAQTQAGLPGGIALAFDGQIVT